MYERINIVKIIKDHFETLREINQVSDGISMADKIIFFYTPFTISLVLTHNNIDILKQVPNLIAAISILGGFLFNLLAIIYGTMDKLKEDAKKETNSNLKKIFVKQIHVNISYCILLSIFSITFLIIYGYEIPSEKYLGVLKKIVLLCNYFILFQFLLTLLMVLNRVYILLKKDIEI